MHDDPLSKEVCYVYVCTLVSLMIKKDQIYFEVRIISFLVVHSIDLRLTRNVPVSQLYSHCYNHGKEKCIVTAEIIATLSYAISQLLC